MQHLQNPFYNESDTSAADQTEWVGPIANIFFPGDNNETLHKHSLTESDERPATSSSCYDVPHEIERDHDSAVSFRHPL